MPGIRNEKPTIQMLLAALDDPQIQKKIREIACASPADEGGFPRKAEISESDIDISSVPAYQKLQKEYEIQIAQIESFKEALRTAQGETAQTKEMLRQEQDAARRTADELRGQLHDVEQKLQQREQDLAASRTKLERLEKVANAYGAAHPYYVAYLALPAGIRRETAGFLSDDDPVQFIVSGCQNDSIFQLWDYLKVKSDSLSEGEKKTLFQILEFFLARFNALWSDPVYEIIRDRAGCGFDEERHSRASDCSRSYGEIRKVVLPGIWNCNKNRAERKSVVWY